jgi:Domain of unknown function (DUF4157)
MGLSRSGFGVGRGLVTSGEGERVSGPVVGKRTLVQQLDAAMPEPVPDRGTAHAQGEVEQLAQQGFRGAAQPLPFLSLIQASFGRHDVRGVRAHVGGPAAEAAGSMGAAAYAMGSSVAFAQAPDLHTAAHEAAHVIQQRAGVHLAGGVGRPGDEHERHADAVADRVVQGRSSEDLLDACAGGGGHNPSVQRRQIDEAVYARFDPKAVRESTKALLEAGRREDEAEAYETQASRLKLRMEQLKQDEMVGPKARGRSAELDSEVQKVTTHKKTITIRLSCAVKLYTETLNEHSDLLASTTPKSARGLDRQAAVEAANELDRKITANMKPFLDVIASDLQAAETACTKIQKIVKSLTTTSNRMHQGKGAYTANARVLDDALKNDDLKQRAEAAGLSPEIRRIIESYGTARESSSQTKWVLAGQQSQVSRNALEQLERQIADAEADRDAYRRLVVELKELDALKARLVKLQLKDGQLGEIETLVDQARVNDEQRKWRVARKCMTQAKEKLLELEALVATIDAYTEYTIPREPKLLPGTIKDIQTRLGEECTVMRFMSALKATYEAQCAVTRYNWLVHLKIVKRTIKGNEDDHYTTFNDAISTFATLRVDEPDNESSVEALCEQLFASTDKFMRIHATRVLLGESYHLYWGDIPSENVASRAAELESDGKLKARYEEMVRSMKNRVRKAKAAHGRVGDNKRGDQTIRLM